MPPLSAQVDSSGVNLEEAGANKSTTPGKDSLNWKQRMLYQYTHVPYFIMLVLGIAGSAYDCARDYGLGTVAVVICGVGVSCILAAFNCGNRESCEKYAFGLNWFLVGLSIGIGGVAYEMYLSKPCHGTTRVKVDCPVCP